MKKYWDLVEIGHTLKESKNPPITRAQIAQFAAASNDYSPLNLDDEFAKNAGFTSAFASGLICLAMAEDAIIQFAKNLKLISLSGTFQRLVWPGDSLTTRGIILRRFQKNAEHRIELTVWCENQAGEVVMKGNCVCSLFKDKKDEENSEQSRPSVSSITHNALIQKYEKLVSRSKQALEMAQNQKELA